MCTLTNCKGVSFVLPKREGEGGLTPSSAALTVPGHVPSHKLRTKGGEETYTHAHTRTQQQECVRLIQVSSFTFNGPTT